MAKQKNDPSSPDEELLRKQLGRTLPYFLKLKEEAAGFAQGWKYYGAKHGWIYKVADRKKALFWLTPIEKGFRLGFSLREQERESLLHLELPDALAHAIRDAAKYPEGYGFRVEVRDRNSFSAAETIIRSLIEMRRA